MMGTLCQWLVLHSFSTVARSTGGVPLPPGIQIDTKDKVVVVTGASSGIGRAVSKQFAKFGLRTVVTGRRLDLLEQVVDEIKTSGGNALAVKQDVAFEQHHIDLMRTAENFYGGVDFVMANAAMEGPPEKLEEWDMKMMKQIFEINVIGVWLSLKHALPSFRKRRGGAFIIVSSLASSVKSDVFGFSSSDAMSFAIPYLTTKGAIDSFARVVAPLYLPENIRVYNMKPGTYPSEIINRQAGHLGLNASDFSGFNVYFKDSLGDPRSLADVAMAMFDNTTRWRPGQPVIIDHDATMSGQVFNKVLDEWGIPPLTKGDVEPFLCDARGGPYSFQHPEL